MIPFPKSVRVQQKIKNLAKAASEEDGDLINGHFLRRPDAAGRDEFFFKKNKGYAQQGTNTSLPAAKRGLALGSFTPSTGSGAGVYAVWDRSTGTESEVYLLGAGDPTSQSVSASLPTQDTDGEFEQVNDVLYYTNGIDPAIKLTASSGLWAALASGDPLSGASTVAKYLAWHNFMLFAARTVTAPNKLNVSDAATPETYSGNTKTFPYAIIGLKRLGEYMMVYTEKTIHAVTGYVPSQLSFRQLENAHPCVSHRSVVTVTKDDATIEHFFLGADYVYACNGSQFRIIGKESWDNIRANLNTAKLNLAAAYYDTDTRQYRLSVCTAANTTNDTTYAYDVTSDLWIKMPYWSACAWAKYGTPTPSVYWLESTAAGKAFLANSGQLVVMPKTTCNGAHTAAITTITVASTTGFPTSGYIVIESETIQYSGTSATTFTGCIRGSSGTTAATHADTTAVYVAPKFRYSTFDMDHGEKNMYKKYQIGWVDVKASTNRYDMDVLVDVDQLGSSLQDRINLKASGAIWGTGVWGTMVWGSESIVSYPENRFAISGRGKTIKIICEENANFQQTELFGLELRCKPLKIK